jgi:hypothetical protein
VIGAGSAGWIALAGVFAVTGLIVRSVAAGGQRAAPALEQVGIRT